MAILPPLTREARLLGNYADSVGATRRYANTDSLVLQKLIFCESLRAVLTQVHQERELFQLHGEVNGHQADLRRQP
jgi:hypothetical protein